ncbi:MAG: YciI family protein [Actinomycetes bacterium]
MRYLTMIKTDESLPAGPPPPELMAAIAELGEQATKDGTLLDQGGLLPSAAGALVRVSGGKVTVIDGPFTEAKELVGGYAMFQVRSKDDAIEAGRRFMEVHAKHWPGFEGVCEVRQVMEPGDFGSAPPS